MTRKMKIRNIALSIGFTVAIAALATLFTDTSSEWYRSLELPAFQPPPLVFTIAWTLLYGLLAASMSLYTITGGYSKTAVLLYFLNGVASPLWTYIFFRCHNLMGAFFLLGAILALSILLYKSVYEKNRTAAYLLLPYVLWLSFALYLSYETAFLN